MARPGRAMCSVLDGAVGVMQAPVALSPSWCRWYALMSRRPSSPVDGDPPASRGDGTR